MIAQGVGKSRAGLRRGASQDWGGGCLKQAYARCVPGSWLWARRRRELLATAGSEMGVGAGQARETGRRTLKQRGIGGGGGAVKGVAAAAAAGRAGSRRGRAGSQPGARNGKFREKTGVHRRLGAGRAGAEKRAWAGRLGRDPAVARRGGEGRGGAQGGGKGRDRSRRRAFLGGKRGGLRDCGARQRWPVSELRSGRLRRSAESGERSPAS